MRLFSALLCVLCERHLTTTLSPF